MNTNRLSEIDKTNLENPESIQSKKNGSTEPMLKGVLNAVDDSKTEILVLILKTVFQVNKIRIAIH